MKIQTQACLAMAALLVLAPAVKGNIAPMRQRLLMDSGWRFKVGDPWDAGNIFEYPEPARLDKTTPGDLAETAKLAPLLSCESRNGGQDPVALNMGANVPIIVDAHKQLFLDDCLLASTTRVRRTVEQAQKFPGNPVLWPTESWEPPMATIYGSVIRDGAKFKMWYKSGMGVGYAESDDGVTWSKPRLDLTLVEGRPSNILFTKKSKTE
ncbi:MAG: hypothetical protein NTX52_14970, partial [Planctomycetota bacterium]|nr:hypothetical protein [Planctomycetota bacterium]